MLTKIAAGVIGLALATSCSAVTAATETELESAYNACTEPTEVEEEESWFDQQGVETSKDDEDSLNFAKYLNLTDEGHTLIIETPGDESEDSSSGLLAYMCITMELDTAERVTSSIENTTSQMGRQSSTDGGLTYEYTYHPDNGLYILITDMD